MKVQIIIVVCLSWNLQLWSANAIDNKYKVPLRMLDVTSSKPDDLICHSYEISSLAHQYVLAYEPSVKATKAHHMMIYGCQKPAETQPTWKCGGAPRGESDICDGTDKRIVYAWALDAPKIELPKDVGLRVGGDTDITHLVLQLHYKDRFPEGETDDSGVTVTMTEEVQKYQMGFYILGNWGVIPPHTTRYFMESACHWMYNYTLHPFAYRTHSHQLGRITSAYRIRDRKWEEIGRMSPQQPETFYPTTNRGMDISPGDVLAARCIMNSWKRDDPTAIGPRNADEMCNFYFMYYTDKRENLNDVYCFKDGHSFHWFDYFSNIPESASTLDGVVLPRPDMEPDDPIYMK